MTSQGSICEISYWLEIASAIGSISTFFALIFAGYTILQSVKSRNVETLLNLSQNLFLERQRAFDTDVFELTKQEFHVHQMTNLIEQSCFLTNQKLISGKTKGFLDSWLRDEIRSMKAQDIYQEVFENLKNAELSELIRFHNACEAHDSATELRKALSSEQHWEKVIAGRRWSTSNSPIKKSAH